MHGNHPKDLQKHRFLGPLPELLWDKSSENLLFNVFPDATAGPEAYSEPALLDMGLQTFSVKS
jgi:hypothetical protein